MGYFERKEIYVSRGKNEDINESKKAQERCGAKEEEEKRGHLENGSEVEVSERAKDERRKAD